MNTFHPRPLAALVAALFIGGNAGQAIAQTQTARAEPQLPEVKVMAPRVKADGSAEHGYRSDSVSAVGPWQGRTLQDTPYSITVIPRELIENVGGSSPDQLFRINPTTQLVRSQHENNQPNVMIRGFRNQNFYRDGLPGDHYNHDVTMEDTERVEILTGLSGFLYGPGNVGGIVNLVSKRPTAERLSRLTLRNNGGENFHLHGDFGGPIDRQGRLGYRINAAYQDGEWAVDGMKLRMNFVSAAFDWRVTDNLLLQVNLSDRDYYNLGGQTFWTVAPGARRPPAAAIDNTRTWGHRWTRRHYENTRYGANLRWEAASWLSLRAGWLAFEGERALSFPRNTLERDGTFTQSVFGIFASSVNPMLSAQEGRRAHLFTDIRFDTGGISHQLVAGVQYSRNVEKRFRNAGPGVVTLTGARLENGPVHVEKPVVAPINRGDRVVILDSTQTTFSIGDDIRFNDRWSLLAGLAYSRIDSQPITAIFASPGYDESAVTPTVSLIYKPLPTITTYASYMESLERGGQAALEFGGRPVVNAGEIMKPLVSQQVEVGVKVSLGGMLLSTALFQIDKGLQYYDLTNPLAPVFVQDGRQVHRGIEFTAFGRLTERWSLVGGLTLLDAVVRRQKQNPALEGKRPAASTGEVAERLARLRAEYDTPWLPGLTLVGGVSYTSDRYADPMNTDRLPSFSLFDVGARYAATLAGRPVTARFEIQNLGNKRYWANGGHIGDPRRITFSLSAAF